MLSSRKFAFGLLLGGLLLLIVIRGCTSRFDIAKREVQRLYEQDGFAAKVLHCSESKPGTANGIDTSTYFRCKVRTPSCTRYFDFDVPRAEEDGYKKDEPASPLGQGETLALCSVPSDPEQPGDF